MLKLLTKVSNVMFWEMQEWNDCIQDVGGLKGQLGLVMVDIYYLVTYQITRSCGGRKKQESLASIATPLITQTETQEITVAGL